MFRKFGFRFLIFKINTIYLLFILSRPSIFFLFKKVDFVLSFQKVEPYKFLYMSRPTILFLLKKSGEHVLNSCFLFICTSFQFCKFFS